MRVAQIVILALLLSLSLTAQYKTSIHVNLDGSGDHVTIQGAVDATKSFPDQPITIYVAAGVYVEKVTIPAWNNRLTIRGAGADKTIIRWNDHFKQIDRGRNSTFHTATVSVEADQVTLTDITIENMAGPVGQAIALAVVGDRARINRCRIRGHQDSLYVAGSYSRQYYSECYIEGTTDFIFGEATAFFERCVIHSLSNSYITAASTPSGREYGLVFYQCQLTADASVDQAYLGRPWRSYAKTAYVQCDMGDHIAADGWDNWSNPNNEKTVMYLEIDNHGPGSATDKRVSWSRVLAKRKHKKYSKEKVLGSFRINEFKPE